MFYWYWRSSSASRVSQVTQVMKEKLSEIRRDYAGRISKNPTTYPSSSENDGVNQVDVEEKVEKEKGKKWIQADRRKQKEDGEKEMNERRMEALCC